MVIIRGVFFAVFFLVIFFFLFKKNLNSFQLVSKLSLIVFMTLIL